MASTASALAALKAHLAKPVYSEQLSSLDSVRKFAEKCYPSLEVKDAHISDHLDGSRDNRWVIVGSANYSLIGGSTAPLKPARIVFDGKGDYSFEVLLKSIQTGSWKASEAPHREVSGILDTLLASSGYVLCPGIRDYDSQYGESIQFKSKNLRIWKESIERHDSTECLLWHKPSNTRIASNSLLYNVCTSCKRLVQRLNTIKTRAEASSPGHREKWTEPSSNRPLKYLSPASRSKRLLKSSKDRKKLRKTVRKHQDDPVDIELSGVQGDEWTRLVQAIEGEGKEQLVGAAFPEADQT